MEEIWPVENKLPYIKEEVTNRAGEMSRQLRELAFLTEVPGSLPSTDMVAHNAHNSYCRGSDSLF